MGAGRKEVPPAGRDRADVRLEHETGRHHDSRDGIHGAEDVPRQPRRCTGACRLRTRTTTASRGRRRGRSRSTSSSRRSIPRRPLWAMRACPSCAGSRFRAPSPTASGSTSPTTRRRTRTRATPRRRRPSRRSPARGSSPGRSGRTSRSSPAVRPPAPGRTTPTTRTRSRSPRTRSRAPARTASS